MVIFKGENLQTAWIPSDAEQTWGFTSNTKGWTSDKIGEEWFTRCFDPATSVKANDGNKVRLLVCDGHGSHVGAETIAFCMKKNIQLLLMPPHSSHLCQPLDVGVFSALKRAMTSEMDRIMRFGIPTIKKFEWADAYRIARSKAITMSNIKSGWSGTGLIPLNRQRVTVRLQLPNSPRSTTPEASTIPPCPFSAVPETPSKLNSTSLRAANTMLLEQINASNLNTPAKQYISRLGSLTENLRARYTASEHQFEEISRIVKRRREHSTGKRIALKDQIVLTTPEMYAKINAAEIATRQKRAKKAPKTTTTTTTALQNHIEEGIHNNEDIHALELDDLME